MNDTKIAELAKQMKEAMEKMTFQPPVPTPTTKCQLCREPNPADPCSACLTMPHEELIEQAHETISGWKTLLIAAAITNGGQIVISAEQLIEAEKRRISISTDPWKDIRITVE